MRYKRANERWSRDYIPMIVSSRFTKIDNACVITAEMQPVRNGHMALIRAAAKECHNALILLCMALIRAAAKKCHNALILLRSANKFNERNPIPIGNRETLVEGAAGHEGHEGLQNVKAVALNDLTDENDNSIYITR